jgi:hypothetical protein
MAELDQNTYTQVENPGAYYPQDYSLETLNFLTGSGQRFEMKKLLMELSYYEDIYNFSVSGYVTIMDAQGFIELLELTGNEFIEINFGKTKNSPNGNDQVYRVYKIGNRKPVGNMNSESYTLYFCSEELLLSEQIKISKSYKGTKISDVIKNILTDKLKVKKEKIQRIEETNGINDFIVPQFKPFEAISWLSTYARPKGAGEVGADMLFYETKDGFNFRSLQSMFRDDIYATYKYQQKSIEDKTQSFQEKTISVLDYEFVKVYDMMNDINSGTLANRLLSIDIMARTSKVTDFNYEKYKSQAKTLNPGSPANTLKNRLGLTNTNSYDGAFKVATGNAFQQNEPYIKQAVDGVAKNIAIETYVPNRTAQISLANYTVLKAKIPGDAGITVGRTIDFNLLTLKPTSSTKNLDEFYSGKYLVTAVRHIIQPSAFQTILEIAKDSTPKKYSGIRNESDAWTEAVKA